MSRTRKTIEAALGTVSPDAICGLYFISKDLETPRVTLKAGTLWPEQSKPHIRGYSAAFGIPDDSRPWHTLPFVTTLVVPQDLANDLLASGADLATAEAALQQWAETRLAQRAAVA